MKRCQECNNLKCICEKVAIDHFEKTLDLYKESSFECPKKIPTPVFSSPNSALPEDQLNELQLCIEEANNLLRTLGAQSDPENTRQLQLHLLKLQGLYVSVKIKCNLKESKQRNTRKVLEKGPMDSIEDKKGVLGTTGRDFIELYTKSGCIFILFERLVSLTQLINDQDHEQDSIKLNVNEELVLNFGEFVSKRPKLINLFFGIPLYKQLKQYIGENVQVKTDKKLLSGTLLSVDENTILLKEPRRKSTINISDICFLEFQ